MIIDFNRININEREQKVADIGINGGGGGGDGGETVTTDGVRMNGVALNMFHTCNFT